MYGCWQLEVTKTFKIDPLSDTDSHSDNGNMTLKNWVRIYNLHKHSRSYSKAKEEKIGSNYAGDMFSSFTSSALLHVATDCFFFL